MALIFIRNVRRFKTVRPLSMSRNYTVYDICNIQIYCLVNYLLYLLTCLLEHRISLSLEIRLNHFYLVYSWDPTAMNVEIIRGCFALELSDTKERKSLSCQVNK